ncbi:SixA phosphatase family protein [Rubellimicrobium aerolatum]|uniref:SixA phosphatase family protein n=1 Tax=Rubellimicrobium aerolatum TaxID=490979 RepID=A0ABW0SDD4_9RHOB|nr:histidine phosphatase family protein [Rubellimicrobium aerolatum]MBP1806792.1 phosphohistidine phosphatase [Rubellimicrobium aerolatum]
MTLTLLLIRHAKSDQGDPALPDHERPLNKRGRRDAPRMGRWIADRGLMPAEVLCSDAARTRETLDLMLPHWSEPPRVRHLTELYHAAPDAMLRALAGTGADRVALVGHNPGIGGLADYLAREVPPHHRWVDFPTTAVAALTFDLDRWADLGEASGTVLAFAIPADVG